MTDNPTQAATLADEARHVLGYLKRHGGSVRIGPLVRHCGLDCDALAAAINELAERRWVKIGFRKPRKVMPPDLPERCRAVDRITTTRFGRWRYSVTWPGR
jgi:hypothetical protein